MAADGAPLPLVPAMLALRGVPLPPGFEGEVALRYEPPRWRAGLLLGGLGLLVVVAVLGATKPSTLARARW